MIVSDDFLNFLENTQGMPDEAAFTELCLCISALRNGGPTWDITRYFS